MFQGYVLFGEESIYFEKKNTHLAFKIEGKDREIIFLIIIA